MPLQPFAPHRSPLMPNAIRNSSLFRRMMRGSWVSETQCLDAGAAPAPALNAVIAKRESEIVFIGTPVARARGNDSRAPGRRQTMKTGANRQFAHVWRRVSHCAGLSGLPAGLSLELSVLAPFTAALVFSAPCLAAAETSWAPSLLLVATWCATSLLLSATSCPTSFAATATCFA